MLAERHAHGFLLLGQDCRGWLLRPHRRITGKGSLLPLRDSLRIDAVTLRQSVQALLTLLYRSTHRLCRAGAAVPNLSHKLSLRSWLYSTPAHRGTKQLEPSSLERATGS